MSTGRWVGAALAAVLMLGACGGDDDDAEAADEPTEASLSVRVTAEEILGCTQALGRSGLSVGVGDQLTVKDEAGTVIATDVFELTTPGTACDFSAGATVRADGEFYTLEAGGELATLSRSELEADDWAVELHITILGDVNRT